jgi:hypothetical protein
MTVLSHTSQQIAAEQSVINMAFDKALEAPVQMKLKTDTPFRSYNIFK